MTVFQVGDEVMWCGIRGKVTGIHMQYPHPVFVEFITGDKTSFLKDGRLLDWHVEPSLKLGSRSKNISDETYY